MFELLSPAPSPDILASDRLPAVGSRDRRVVTWPSPARSSMGVALRPGAAALASLWLFLRLALVKMSSECDAGRVLRVTRAPGVRVCCVRALCSGVRGKP